MTSPAGLPAPPPIELTLTPDGRLYVQQLTPELLPLLLEIFPGHPELLSRLACLTGGPQDAEEAP